MRDNRIMDCPLITDSHGVSQDGYQTELFFHPKHDLEIAILTNGGDETYELQAMVMRAIITHYN